VREPDEGPATAAMVIELRRKICCIDPSCKLQREEGSVAEDLKLQWKKERREGCDMCCGWKWNKV
jgi:hypothetical protein